MVIYITIILAFVLLQLVKETYPRIHSIVYTIYIFLFLTYIFTVLIIPYVSQYISVIPANLLPVFKLLLFSVVLLFLSQIIEELFWTMNIQALPRYSLLRQKLFCSLSG